MGELINNWHCNNCYHDNFQVNMSNSDCPVCGSSDIDRVLPQEPEKLYTKKEILKLYDQYIKECRKDIQYEGISFTETFEEWLFDK